MVVGYTAEELTDEEGYAEEVALEALLRRHRWPYEPLDQALGGTLAGQATLLGVHDSQLSRWREDGLTDRMADRCALRAGLHPRNVWGDAWDDVVTKARSSTSGPERRLCG